MNHGLFGPQRANFLRNTANIGIIRQISRIRGVGKPRRARLTRTGHSLISPPTVRDGPVRPGAARLGRSPIGPIWSAWAGISGHPSFLGELPGQRRTTREADLSTQQIGAQAPSRFPCPPGDHRRPQSPRRPPRARPEAPERLNGPPRNPLLWIGCGSGRTSSPLPMGHGPTALPSWCSTDLATTMARSGSDSP